MAADALEAPPTSILIRVGPEDFDAGLEYQGLRQRAPGHGALVLFTGLVRDQSPRGALQGMRLEHYPAMTGKCLQRIAEQAAGRWQLAAVTIIHRVGELAGDDQIVLVGVAAHHRQGAFDGAQFIMDYLKTEAPFWKQEIGVDGDAHWVEAKASDQQARERW
ncbi:MAG: molybdenum cofactor biosynthesis protein MoaE [Pseudomonadota bacterium]|nr:molybdenum cofactor biosynthesis protein MoaE [Pseudomonadales bacterium]MDY6921795.1 molybdenum cofactor biosynthesis protein MoaE [Pseudomonadota bacterium]